MVVIMPRTTRRSLRPHGVSYHGKRYNHTAPDFMMQAVRNLLLHHSQRWTDTMRERIENAFEWHDKKHGNTATARSLLKYIPSDALLETALVTREPHNTYPYIVSPGAAKLLNDLPLQPRFEFSSTSFSFLTNVGLEPRVVQQHCLQALKRTTPKHTHPSLTLTRVPKDDPRVGLRDQRAVFTRNTLAAGTYLGTYSGVLTTTREVTQWFPQGSVGEALHSLYALQADNGELVPGANTMRNELTIYPLGGTDLMHMVNDARLNPFHASPKKRHIKLGENAAFICFRWMKGLYMSLVASVPIQAGEEIKLDYGNGYWDDE